MNEKALRNKHDAEKESERSKKKKTICFSLFYAFNEAKWTCHWTQTLPFSGSTSYNSILLCSRSDILLLWPRTAPTVSTGPRKHIITKKKKKKKVGEKDSFITYKIQLLSLSVEQFSALCWWHNLWASAPRFLTELILLLIRKAKTAGEIKEFLSPVLPFYVHEWILAGTGNADDVKCGKYQWCACSVWVSPPCFNSFYMKAQEEREKKKFFPSDHVY